MKHLIWGPFEIHPRYATEHFMVTGASGSGKTILLEILMKSALEGSTRQSRRAVIYDPKQEVIPILYGLDLGTRIKILHPFDRRSCAWDMAHDIDGPLAAREVATILVPDPVGGKNTEMFFLDALRDLLAGVFLVFMNCVPNETEWTFRDILLTMLYDSYMRFILFLDRTRDGTPFPIATRLWQSYLDPKLANERTLANIRATINTRLAVYEPVAAAWDHARMAGNLFSLSDWSRDGCNDILVIGNDETSRSALDPINAALFKRISEMLLARRELSPQEQEEGENTSWVFFDEVREAGYLDGLGRLMTKGRSKGVCVVLGFQDIDGLRAVYGAEVAHEITGQCSNIAVLKMNSPTAAQWGADIFGRFLGPAGSTTIGSRDMSLTKNVAGQERAAMYSRDFLTMPKTGPANGLTGIFRHSNSGPEGEVKATLDWVRHIDQDRPKASAEECHAAFLPRDKREQYLRPWDVSDWKRLGFSGSPPPFRVIDEDHRHRPPGENPIKTMLDE